MWSIFGVEQDLLHPALGSYRDPRLSKLGFRMLMPSNRRPPIPANFLASNAGEFGSHLEHQHELFEGEFGQNSYQIFRTLLGVPEGHYEMLQGVSLPFEVTIDYLNAVSFDKGCYLGQELTARTFHTGVTRKRLFPLILRKFPLLTPMTVGSISADPQHPQNVEHITLFPDWLFERDSLTWHREKFPKAESPLYAVDFDRETRTKTGKIFSNIFNIGFGMVRMEHVGDKVENTVLFSVENEADVEDMQKRSGLRIIPPHWWNSYLEKLKQEMSGGGVN